MGKFTVLVSIPPQSSADDGLTAMGNLLFWLPERHKNALDRKRSSPVGIRLFRSSSVFCLALLIAVGAFILLVSQQ